MDINQLVVNTSWITALGCFAVAYMNIRLYLDGWQRKAAMLNVIAWLFWGGCYLATQFGPEWFLQTQRAFFRLATAMVTGATLYKLYVWNQFLGPIIKANNATRDSKRAS